MTWTTTTPTRSGFYWFQPTYSTPRVVRPDVGEFVGGWYFVCGVEDPQQCREAVGRWCGPIGPPSEHKPAPSTQTRGDSNVPAGNSS